MAPVARREWHPKCPPIPASWMRRRIIAQRSAWCRALLVSVFVLPLTLEERTSLYRASHAVCDNASAYLWPRPFSTAKEDPLDGTIETRLLLDLSASEEQLELDPLQDSRGLTPPRSPRNWTWYKFSRSSGKVGAPPLPFWPQRPFGGTGPII